MADTTHETTDDREPHVIVMRSLLDPDVWIAAAHGADLECMQYPGRLRAVRRWAEMTFGRPDATEVRWVKIDPDTYRLRQTFPAGAPGVTTDAG